MDLYEQIVDRIIKEQEAIIGPLAVDQAKRVRGIFISGDGNVKIEGDNKDIIEHLVSQYAKLFGKTSVQVCKQAIEPIKDKIPSADLPDILKN